MARITLKISKPVDPTAPPKVPSSRARRALRSRALPKLASAAPSAPARSPGPVSTQVSSSPAALRLAPTTAPASARHGKPPADASRRRRAASAAGPAADSGDRRKPGFAPGAKRASGTDAKKPVPAAKAAPAPARPPRHENPDDPRLSKRMSELGLCSRREADEWIENGWVKVDGKVVTTLGVRVSPHARIDVDPAAARHQSEQVTILLNKPIGYVSGQAEDGYQPAMVLIKPENRWADDPSPIKFRPGHLRGLAPAGRLDIDSTGLIVFTQDGRIARQLVGRDSAVEKEYLVRVEGTLSDA